MAKPWRQGSSLRAVRVGDHYELREVGGVWSFDELAERAEREQQADIDAHIAAFEAARG
jgi:urease beta subunit